MSVIPYRGTVGARSRFVKGRFARRAAIYKPVSYSPLKRYRFESYGTVPYNNLFAAGAFPYSASKCCGFVSTPYFISRYDAQGSTNQIRNPGIARQSDKLRVVAWNAGVTVHNLFPQALGVRIFKFTNNNPLEILSYTPIAWGFGGGQGIGMFSTNEIKNLYASYIGRQDENAATIMQNTVTQTFNYDLCKRRSDLYCDKFATFAPYHAVSVNDSDTVAIGAIACNEYTPQTWEYEMPFISDIPTNYEVKTGIPTLVVLLVWDRSADESLTPENLYFNIRSEIVYYDL